MIRTCKPYRKGIILLKVIDPEFGMSEEEYEGL
jgi:hypothetical protein